jgi:hypothetical protein
MAMCQITIQVSDQQYDFFMQLVRNLAFVKGKQESSLEARLRLPKRSHGRALSKGLRG